MTRGMGPPASNRESWDDVLAFVRSFPDDERWRQWKRAVEELLRQGRADGLDDAFRAGQSMHYLIFSTLDRHRLDDEPRVTVAWYSPSELEISYGRVNRGLIEARDIEHAEVVAGEVAYPVLTRYLRRLWLETREPTSLPAALRRD